MSRHIDRNKPLSDEDKEYLATRADGNEIIRVNEALFGHLSDEEKDAVTEQGKADADEDEAAAKRQQELDDSIPEYDEDVLEQVAPLNVEELKLRLKDEGVKIPSDAKKEDLQDLLLDALQDKKDAAADKADDNA